MRTTSTKSKNKHNPPKGSNAGNRKSTAASDLAASGVSTDERHHLIAQAAYFIAEQRSFSPGHELEDWLTAETQIDEMLSESVGTRLRRE